MRRAAVLAAVLLAVLPLSAGEEVPAADVLDFVFAFDRDTQTYAVGEAIRVDVTMTRDGRPVPHGRFRCVLEGEDAVREDVWKETDGTGHAVIETKLDRPGFIRARLLANNGAGKEFGKRFGVAVAPAELRPARPRPADFDAYWDAVVADLRAMPFDVEIVPVPVDHPDYAGRVVLFDVQLNTPGDKPFLYGRLCLPQDAAPRSLPIVMHYHHAGFRGSGSTYRSAADGFLSFDVNAHALPNGRPAEFYERARKENEPGFRIHGADDRDRQYFRNMIVRAVRALHWLKTRPEWDGRTVVVRGGSQGGGQALAVAALDPDVTLCLANVPAFCDHGGPQIGRDGGWPGILRGVSKKHKKEHGTDMSPEQRAPFFRACDYVDNAFFASRIGAGTAVRMSLGYFDATCPAVGVYAAYNAVASPDKQLIEDRDSGHGIPPRTHEAFAKEMARHREENKKE